MNTVYLTKYSTQDQHLGGIKDGQRWSDRSIVVVKGATLLMNTTACIAMHNEGIRKQRYCAIETENITYQITRRIGITHKL